VFQESKLRATEPRFSAGDLCRLSNDRSKRATAPNAPGVRSADGSSATPFALCEEAGERRNLQCGSHPRPDERPAGASGDTRERADRWPRSC
jgi:hypothetical protein